MPALKRQYISYGNYKCPNNQKAFSTFYNKSMSTDFYQKRYSLQSTFFNKDFLFLFKTISISQNSI